MTMIADPKIKNMPNAPNIAIIARNTDALLNASASATCPNEKDATAAKLAPNQM